MTREMAEEKLRYRLHQIAADEWKPPAVMEAPVKVPTFHEYASQWFAEREQAGLRPRTIEHLRWALVDHLLPAFHNRTLDRIGPDEVRACTTAKLRGRVDKQGRHRSLSPASCNRLVQVLASVLEDAIESGHIDRNPAASRRRRLHVEKPARMYLDRADHIAALLDAASELDREGRTVPYRRALLATLTLAGLRIGEALDLQWRDVELGAGRLKVRAAKTAAGTRTVELLPALRDDLAALAARRRGTDPNALVFGTATGERMSPSNVRRRVLAVAVERANDQLVDDGVEPLPDGLTPHALRRTFASLLYALGKEPPRVMRQMGHTSPALALAIYAGEMDLAEGEAGRLQALVGLPYRAPVGTSVGSSSQELVVPAAA